MSKLSFCSYVLQCSRRAGCKHVEPHEYDIHFCKARRCAVNDNVFVTCMAHEKRQYTVGTRVIFVDNTNDYDIEKNNPLIGTDFFCCGEVVSIGGGIVVRWDNGHDNTYQEGDLDYEFQIYYWMTKGRKRIINPNIAFAQRRKSHGKKYY